MGFTKDQILQLIDEWVDTIPEHELNETARQKGSTLFKFMQSRGVNAGLLASTIQQVTGMHPRNLWRLEDAERLRQLIANYEGPVAFTEDDEHKGVQGTAERNFRFFWRR